jgi:hypothetical protein
MNDPKETPVIIVGIIIGCIIMAAIIHIVANLVELINMWQTIP